MLVGTVLPVFKREPESSIRKPQKTAISFNDMLYNLKYLRLNLIHSDIILGLVDFRRNNLTYVSVYLNVINIATDKEKAEFNHEARLSFLYEPGDENNIHFYSLYDNPKRSGSGIPGCAPV